MLWGWTCFFWCCCIETQLIKEGSCAILLPWPQHRGWHGNRALQQPGLLWEGLTAFLSDTGAGMERVSQQLRLKQENEYRNYVC